MKAVVDLTGTRFGRLTAIERAPDRIYTGRHFIAWFCQCDCGGTRTVGANELRRGLTKSCGCLKREPSKRTVNLTGKRFGRLTAKQRVGTKFGKALWSFDCDCGTKDFLATQNAVAKHKTRGYATQSCGCWNKECLFFGPNPHRIKRPRFAVKTEYPAPHFPDKSEEFNIATHNLYQHRWDRIEKEAIRDEREGRWLTLFTLTPKQKKFVCVDEYGTPVERLDLMALSKQKAAAFAREQAEAMKVQDIPSSNFIGASVADRVRVVSEEEWARLSR